MVDPRIAYRARNVPKVHPEAQRGSLEEVADDLGLWIEATADAVASAMMDGDRAPFSARVSQARLAEYYGTTLWDQNGTPNGQLWAREYARVGADGLREAVDGGAKWRREQGLPVTLPPPTAFGQSPPELEEPMVPQPPPRPGTLARAAQQARAALAPGGPRLGVPPAPPAPGEGAPEEPSP